MAVDMGHLGRVHERKEHTVIGIVIVCGLWRSLGDCPNDCPVILAIS